jgi:hypothetical protein
VIIETKAGVGAQHRARTRYKSTILEYVFYGAKSDCL